MVGKATRCFVAGDVTVVVSGLIEAKVLERVGSRTDRMFVKAIAVGLDLLGVELISSMVFWEVRSWVERGTEWGLLW